MKKCIVVGATSGIGRELAKIYSSNGYLVGITGRRENLLVDLKKENPESYIIKSFDISVPYENSKNLDELVNELGGLDVVIISSGVGFPNEELEYKIEKDTFDTNIIGVSEIADWSFNYFKKQGHGQIAIISSIAGIRGGRFNPAYSASKAFQMNYSEGLRAKAKKMKLPIYVTDIRPGFVDTAMAKSPAKFWVATPKKAAIQIFNAVKKRKKIAYITKRWIIIAYIFKLMPKWIFDRI